MSRRKKDYEVGYGKPPGETRFRKGQSGNPSGRPKRARNLKTAVTQELDATIEVTLEGKRRKISRREALIKGLYAKAMNGNTKSAELLIRLDERFVGIDGAEDADVFATRNYDAIIEDFLKHHSPKPGKVQNRKGKKDD